MAPEVAQRSRINGEERGRGYPCSYKLAGEKLLGYQMMSCDRLRCIFNGALELCLWQIRKCNFLSDPCVFGCMF